MKQYFIFTLLLPVILILVSCGGKDLKSVWLEQEIKADGNGGDWKNIPLEYDEDLNLMYGIANSDTGLYLLIKLNDPMLEAKIARRGMTIWFNDQDEKEKIFGIKYSAEFLHDSPPERFNAAGEKSGEDRNNKMRMRPEHQAGIFLFVKSNGDAESLAGSSMSGLQAAADYNGGIFSYEFSVPLNRLFGEGTILSVPENNKIKSCLEIGGMSKEDKARMNERMPDRGRGGKDGGGGRGGGMKGMGGGRRGGGMGPGGSMGGEKRMPGMEGKELWLNVELAGEPQK